MTNPNNLSPADIKKLAQFLSPEERAELELLVVQDVKETIWRPLPGPQTMAFNSTADVIGFGGAAGGGKTDLAVGKTLTSHHRAAIFRREATQLTGIIDRLTEITGSRDGYNGADKIWRNAGPRGVQIEFGSVPNAGDEAKHQGRPKDLLVIDEAANFLESQVRFLMGWVRSTREGQRSQTLMTFNPPTTAEGRWVIPFFGPWLDPQHPKFPQQPGAICYCASIDGKDVWVDSPRPFVMHPDGEKRVYKFNPDDYQLQQIITPLGRTFIPSRISDNPYLAGSGYMSVLQSLPEPLRSQMLLGDFSAGMQDDAFQVIPTAWVDAAMARWVDHAVKPPMDSLGVDIARGGRDSTILQARHGMWFDKPKVYPGKETPDGPTVAGLVIAALRDRSPIHLDVIGVGASPYDFLREANQDVIGVNVSERAVGTDKSGRLGFMNQRSQLWWNMREALDPAANNGIALPPDAKLKADLCAPLWHMSGEKIQVEGREDIVRRIGRSPDYASAAVLALMDSPKREVFGRTQSPRRGEYNPLENEGLNTAMYGGKPYDHDPYSFV